MERKVEGPVAEKQDGKKVSRTQCGSISQLRQRYWYAWLYGIWGRETDAFLTELFLLSLLTLQQKLQRALQGVVH